MDVARTKDMGSSMVVESLRNRIRKLETAGRHGDTKVVSTGCRELDQCLPERGLATGTITEWLTPSSGLGADLLALLAARAACADGGALVIVDQQRSFFPAAAKAWGISLDNVIVLRDPTTKSSTQQSSQTSKLSSTLLWSIDQALRCPAVAAVWGTLGQVHERWLRRFQLSAEQSGAMGMFVRPLNILGQPGWSEVQWQVGQALPTARQSTRSALCRPDQPVRRSAPMQHAFQTALQKRSKNQQRSTQHTNRSVDAGFDRVLDVRLLRARSGAAKTQKEFQLRIDFTTGKVTVLAQPTVGIPDHERTETTTTTESALHLAAQLAHPKTGRRQQRA